MFDAHLPWVCFVLQGNFFYMTITHDFDLPEGFDTDKMKKMDKKVEKGEVKQCSIENGPDCESCSG